jgi:hypothetical protein
MAGRTFIYVGAEADGLYRKEANDTQWEKLAKGMPPAPQVRAIAIHPNDSSVVFVGTQRGIYRSKDSGDSFERMEMAEGRIVWAIKFHPNDANIMFLGTEGSEVFKSTNGGENWTQIATIENRDSVQMAFATRILGIGIESQNPDQMYAALEVGGAAHSSDGGKTWEIVNKEFDGDVDLMDLHGVAVGASDSVFISNRTGVWRTTDRGQNWQDLNFEKFSDIRYSRGVEVAPNDPNTLYACVGLNFGSEQGGIMRTTDQGETWSRFDKGAGALSTTFGIAINEHSPEQVYFCTRKGQVFGTHDGGESWKEHVLPEMAANVKAIACASA